MLSIFQSAGVKAANVYVATLESGAADWMSWPAVRRRTVQILKAMGSELPVGPDNQKIVLAVIRKVLWDDLTSGAHHTYRGVLSAGGHDRKALFIHFEMVRFSKRLMTVRESDQALQELERAIKIAG